MAVVPKSLVTCIVVSWESTDDDAESKMIGVSKMVDSWKTEKYLLRDDAENYPS